MLMAAPLSTSALPDIACGSARLLSAYDYWRRCGGQNRLPGRQHIDPVDIPALLPDLMLVDFGDGHYRCRLAGTRVVEHFSQELTGRVFNRDLLGKPFDAWIRALERARCGGQPVGGNELWWDQREHHPFQWLFLPLATDGRTVDKLMVVFDWL